MLFQYMLSKEIIFQIYHGLFLKNHKNNLIKIKNTKPCSGFFMFHVELYKVYF